jgi:succinoglycan biosynthesis transport protein ExoP
VELKQYSAVIRRNWHIVALCTLAAFAAATILALRGPAAYQATMRLAISVIPDPRVGDFFKYDSYYSWLASEYLADDLSEVLKSDAFAQDVSAELGFSIEPTTVAGLTRTKKTHRLLDVTIQGSDRQTTLAIAEAFERVINTKLPEYFAFLQANNGYVKIINRPRVARANALPLTAAEIGLRTIAGLFVGIGLAFLRDYLDDRARDRRQVEQDLGLPVLGEIPAT